MLSESSEKFWIFRSDGPRGRYKKEKKTDLDWHTKLGDNEDGGQHRCTLLIDIDAAGNVTIAPDEPHIHLRKGEKRTLIWEIDPDSVADNWRFAEDVPTGVYPMEVGWKNAAEAVELTTVGSREILYRLNRTDTRLTAWFNPRANAVKRSLRYQLYVYNTKSGLSKKQPFDPIIENDGF